MYPSQPEMYPADYGYQYGYVPVMPASNDGMATVQATVNGGRPSEIFPQYTQAGVGAAETRLASGYLQFNNRNNQLPESSNSQFYTSAGLVQPHPYMSGSVANGYSQPTIPAATQSGTFQFVQQNYPVVPEQSHDALSPSSATAMPKSTRPQKRPSAGAEVQNIEVSQLHLHHPAYSDQHGSLGPSNSVSFTYADTLNGPVPLNFPSNQFTPQLPLLPSTPQNNIYTGTAVTSVDSTACVLQPGTNQNVDSNVAKDSKISSNVELLQQLQPEKSITYQLTVDKDIATSGTALRSTASKATVVPQADSQRDTLLYTFDPFQAHSTVKQASLEQKIKSTQDNQEKELKKDSTRLASKDPYSEQDILNRLIAEVDRFEKVVEGLVKQSLNGPTPLDQKWKELTDAQDKESRKLAISVARCYSLKNRLADVMPYDMTRVKLTSTQDDYINASHLKEVSQSPLQFIATQAPLPATMADFWMMVFEQNAEIIVCLMGDAELKNQVYWPQEKNQTLTFDSLSLSLQSSKTKPWGVERVITLLQLQTRITKVVIHLQCTIWPPSENPGNMSYLLQLVTETLGYQQQQRILSRPLIVHCSAGIGRTGVYCLIASAVLDINNGRGIIHVSSAAARMTQMRKYIIQDKDQLRFCYEAILYYARDLLMKRGILSSKPTFEDKLPTTAKMGHTRHPSEDFVLGTSDLNKLKLGVDKLSSDKGKSDEPKRSDSVQSDERLNFKKAASQAKSSQDDDEQSVGSSASDQALSRSNSIASVGSATSNSSFATDSPQHTLSKSGALPPNLAKLDATNFSLDPLPSKSRRKITRQSFLNPTGNNFVDASGDPNDPLNQLDPLWTHHKRET